MGNSNNIFNVFNYNDMIKPEWHFMQTQMSKKKLIQKLQQLLDKLPKGEKRKAIREKLLNLKLGKKNN